MAEDTDTRVLAAGGGSTINLRVSFQEKAEKVTTVVVDVFVDEKAVRAKMRELLESEGDG